MNKKEILKILKDDSINSALFNEAGKIRRKECGNIVHLRGLIEFSNVCRRNCLYCGINCKNKNVVRYTMSEDEILSCAKNATELGFKTIVLQSGEGDNVSLDKMCSIIEKIKELNVALTLSLGEKTKQEYKAYKDAGADRYLLRIETTDEKLYKKMHPDGDFKNRINCLYTLKKLGYETGTGILVGLPYQEIDSYADDILFFKKLNADMIGLGPFIAHSQTELKDAKNGDLTLALKVMALTRIIMPKINIPATTAMETIEKNGRIKALRSGANVVMPNVTPENIKENYSIYPDKKGVDVYKNTELNELKKEIASIGDSISDDFGTSKNYKNN